MSGLAIGHPLLNALSDQPFHAVDPRHLASLPLDLRILSRLKGIAIWQDLSSSMQPGVSPGIKPIS
jgi:hypothetical protein